MKNNVLLMLICIALTFMLSDANCHDLTPEMLGSWTNYVTPLPKEIKITASVRVPVNKIWLNSSLESVASSQMVTQAMTDFFRAQAGVSVKTAKFIDKGFEIRFVLCNPKDRTDGLAVKVCNGILSVANSDQAYVISAENKRLIIAAFTMLGLRYGVATFQQLVLPFIKKESGGVIAQIPVMTVTDWPDLAERGFWGHGYDKKDIGWFSDFKLNVMELYKPNLIHDMGIDSKGKGWVKIDEGLIDYAHRNGVKVIPIVFHIDQLHQGLYPGLKDMFERYPEMKVKYYYKNPSDYYPCGSSERFIGILYDWLTALAENPLVRDISVWLSEWDKTGCACDQCKKLGRQGSEAKALIIAWERVRQKYPDKHLWLLPYIGSSSVVLSMIPAGTNIHVVEYNYSLKSVPIIPKALSKHASNNGWVGIYSLFSGSSNSVFPSHMASMIRDRMAEFKQKGVRKVSGYTGMSSSGLYDFNMAAAAEWSWNQAGRSTREFAIAYVKRKQFRNPEKFAEWVIKIEPIEQRLRSIYQSGRWFDKHTVGSGGKKQISFGQGPLEGYEKYDQLMDDWRIINECQILAGQLDRKEEVYETEIYKGYLSLLVIYARMISNLDSCSSNDAALIWQEIDSTIAGLSGALENYCGAMGDPEDRWFLKKSLYMHKENIDQINKNLKNYLLSKCN